MPEKQYHEKTYSELLAEEAQNDKASMVSATLKAFREGDSAAIKAVTKAIEDSKYAENKDFPLNDEQYQQIIQLAARRLSGEFKITAGA